MGIIIHYDFRRNLRRKQIAEIYDRTYQRLLNYTDDDMDLNKEQQQIQDKDNQQLLELQAEEIIWAKTGPMWIENLNKEKTE